MISESVTQSELYKRNLGREPEQANNELKTVAQLKSGIGVRSASIGATRGCLEFKIEARALIRVVKVGYRALRQEEEKDTVDRIRTHGNVSGFWGSLVPSLPRTKRSTRSDPAGTAGLVILNKYLSAARFILRSEEIDRKGSKTKAYILTGCGRRESNPGLPPSTYSWHNVGGMHRAPRPRFNRSAHMPRRIPSLLNHPHVEHPGEQTVSTTTYTHHARDRVGDGGHQLGIAIIAPALVHEAARETRSRLPVDEP
ncbi:hypothetical protein DFH09DRAFT_1090400 [Mycena vulgaris]|nr:hypothetical protein DFH09DRAFT_1090400 [Mycena vulgaris]